MQGVFLVIEGTDGSGKGTQFELLVNRLRKEGHDVETFDFPQYDNESSYFVREYLNGNYGTAEQVGPYTGSLFYALDRYEAAFKIRKALNAGKIVVANRFTGSNMAHQGTKFNNTEERMGYFLWLDAIEFQTLKIPRPTLSVVLRVPAEAAQKLVDKKEARKYTNQKRDIHEADLNHLKKAVEVYDNLCQLFPKDFKQLDCTRNGELLDIDTIHNLIWETFTPLLPLKRKKIVATAAAKAELKQETPTYTIPNNFDDKTKTQYIKILDSIIATHSKISSSLIDYLRLSSLVPKAKQDDEWLQNTAKKAQAISQAVLPVATTDYVIETSPNSKVKQLAQSQLAETYSIENNPVTLTSVWPRNELDLVADMLYPHSGLSLQQITNDVSSWSYAQKQEVFEAYLSERSSSVLEKVRYSWDIVSAFSDFLDFVTTYKSVTCVNWQILTPRYGYDVPEIIVEAGLTDDFEACYDLSLKLYSILQSAGYDAEAQYATLIGHRMRWKATVTGHDVIHVAKTASDNQPLTRLIHSKIAEIHPLIAESTLPVAALA